MKKYISILMIALVMLTCSKNDDDNATVPVVEHKIIGKWQHIAFNDDVAPFEWVDVVHGAIIEYDINGTYSYDLSYNNFESHYQRTYQINGSEISLYFLNGELAGTYEFEINENNELISYGLLNWDKFIRIPIQE
ncbi:lipocalin family protein [Bizionia sp.]|uniref:lipocalin family protein n=1 Tax=Bizionia sp. TaxID=1954480 RepID=UPI003A9191F8